MISRIRTRALLTLLTATIALSLSCTDNNPVEPPAEQEAFHVISTMPYDGEIAVSRTPEIVVKFSDKLSPATITSHTVSFDPPISFRIECQVGSDSAIFRPNDSLDYDRTYRLHLSTTIKSAAGENLDKETVVWMHTLLPSQFIAGVIPLDGQVGAPLNAPIKVMFTIPMDPSTINSQTIRMSSTMTTRVAYDSASMTAIITPDGPLFPDIDYSLTVSAGVMTLGGSPIGEAYTWQFHTADRYFHVDMTNPLPGESGVSPYDTISLAFSSPIDTATISPTSIYLTPSTEYTYEYDDLNGTMQVYPSVALNPGDSYQLTVTDAVRARDGDRMTQNAVFDFTIQERRVLYVAPGGAGDGSELSPLGSIQAAVDSAIADPSLTTVYAAIGEYDELVQIDGPVEIVGGFDPAANWQPSATDSTVITGGTVNANGLGMVIKNPGGGVTLRSLTIVAPDADGGGGGSFGLVCSGADHVTLTSCAISAGNGAAGIDGIAGRAGDSAHWATPGLLPWPGGLGGAGGIGESADGLYPATMGSPGQCPDSTESVPPEESADPGASGADGAGGSQSLAVLNIAGYMALRADDGEAGEHGEGACGGGGARGTANALHPNNLTGDFEIIPGCDGLSGGGGGAGGDGGGGGEAGGCSVGLLLIASTVQTSSVSIHTSNGGRGGDGAAGAPGGTGAPGGDWTPCWSDIGYSGYAGGDGGDGGNGGAGGGGSGGWSIGIAFSSGSTIGGTQPTISLGAAGPGGNGVAGNSGHSGSAVNVTVLD